jgi:hypothetical protein
VKRIIYLGIALFFILFLAFCSDGGLAPDRRSYIIPDKNISYYEDLQPMFNGKCGFGSQCHTAENIYNSLFFDNKDSFINYELSETGAVLVDPIKDKEAPDFAPLYQIVKGRYVNLERQPPLSFGREPLTKNQIDGIRQWILEGAPD